MPKQQRARKEATANSLKGHCLCGACQYRSGSGEPLWVGHCHCTMCRRASGSAFLTWVALPIAHFEITGPVKFFRSSMGVVRGFCRQCGSPLTFQYTLQYEKIFITAGTLAFPERLAPDENIHWKTHLHWATAFEQLPFRAAEMD